MSNLHTKAGVNNCYWNIDGKCTNPDITGNKPIIVGGSGRDWDSKVNCTVTQDGAQMVCSGYFFDESHM